jgi:hypothetical protein
MLEITADAYQPNGLEFDAKDLELATQAVTAREFIQGPRVGDFVVMPDGESRRFTHRWPIDIQTSIKGSDGGGGFFIYGDGSVSFSGSLDRAIPLTQLQQLDESRQGRFWFFHHGWTKAHNAVSFYAPCRVFQVCTGEKG